MAMLQIECNDCLSTYSLRGYIVKEDLIGTEYENRINTITEQELNELYKKDKIKDEWDRWDGKCPNCGSKNVMSF